MEFDRRNLGIVGAAAATLGSSLVALELPKYERLSSLDGASGMVTHVRAEDRVVPLALGGRCGGFPIMTPHQVFTLASGLEVAVEVRNIQDAIKTGDVINVAVDASNRLAAPVIRVSKQ